MILRKIRLGSLAAPFAGREITLDFTELPAGVYAFVGTNGAGKTTALEALLPGLFYRRFPSYNESIQQKATSRKAFLEGEFTIGDVDHRVVIQADPQAGGRGKTEAYWYRLARWFAEGEERQIAEPAAGPILADFDAYRAKFMPSLELVLAGPFCAQKVNRPNGSFFSAAPADRKALFVEALALGHLQDESEKYREKAQRVQAMLADFDGEIRGLTPARDPAAIEARLIEIDVALSPIDVDELEKRAREWRDAARDFAARAEQHRKATRDYEVEQGRLTAERCQLAAEGDEIRALELLDVPDDAALAKLNAARAQAADELHVWDRRERLAEQLEPLLELQLAAAQVDLSLEICRACPLTANAREAAEKTKLIEAELAPLVTRHAHRDCIDRDTAAAIALQQAALLRARTDDLSIRQQRHKERMMAHEKAMRAWEAKQQPPVGSNAPNAEGSAREAEQKLTEARRMCEHHNAEKHALKERLRIDAENAARRAELEKTRDALRLDLAAYRLLAASLGRDGLQAVHIDEAGPAIELLTNDLLHATFGPRFSVAFETRRLKKGKRHTDADAYSEVFDVRILDAWQNREGTQGSGGETVWFDTAFRLAMSIYLTAQSGFEIRTLCFDEPSGGLSAEFAPRFTQMLQAARKIGGFHHVFLVSHQREVWGACDGWFVFKQGTVRYVEDVATVEDILASEA